MYLNILDLIIEDYNYNLPKLSAQFDLCPIEELRTYNNRIETPRHVVHFILDDNKGVYVTSVDIKDTNRVDDFPKLSY